MNTFSHLLRAARWSLAGLFLAAALHAAPPNVLFISVDDLNDWTGALGGHPQADTPAMDSLAERGTLFTNAHCQSPVCNPSRISMMLSRYPHTTGVYFLNPVLRDVPALRDKVTLPDRFGKEGYAVMGVGKLFHSRANAEVFNRAGEYGGNFGGFGPTPKKKLSHPIGHPLWDWGAFPEKDTQMPDHKIADWAIERLQRDYDKPFFLAVGFFRPHVPMFAPKPWFEKHPLAGIQLPAVHPDDNADISPYARDLTTLKHVAPTHEWIVKNKEWEHAVQSYLASVSFVDHCVGRVLAALDKSPYRDNTIIVLFSDHGFHLGEKERWAKRSIWDDGVRVPIILAGSGLPQARRSNQPVGLIDLYPTLLDLCGMAPDPAHEGRSLAPLLKDPTAAWDRPILSSYGPGNTAVRSERWRYIRYRDGSEELYDHENDPHEWHNLATQPAFAKVLQAHRKFLPETEAPILGGGSTGHHSFNAAEKRLTQRTQ